MSDEPRKSDKYGELMTQTEARQEAKRLYEESGIMAIAGPVPLNSWGGQEKGWTVYIVSGVYGQ